MQYKFGDVISKAAADSSNLRLSQAINDGTPYTGIVTLQKTINGTYIVLSDYHDMEWTLPESWFPKSSKPYRRQLNFNKVPECYVDVAKHCAKIDIQSGHRGSTIVVKYKTLQVLLNYLASQNIRNTSNITPLVTIQYVNHLKTRNSYKGKRLSAQMITMYLRAVEYLHQCMTKTEQSFPHPWPDSSAYILAGVRKHRIGKPKTLLIPDEVFSRVFKFANSYLERSTKLLKLQDIDTAIKKDYSHLSNEPIWQRRTASLKRQGYDSVSSFYTDILLLESACWWIILGTTGIRVHELCEIEADNHYSKLDEYGERYYFIVSRSLKTGYQLTSWLCPEIAIRALDVITCLSAPLRDALDKQQKEAVSRGDHITAERAERVRRSCLLTKNKDSYNTIDVQDGRTINSRLRRLVKAAGADWHYSSHQSRRTFAHFVAHNQLGDLRYLRDHYKHWSLDMTSLYALDEALDLELFTEINNSYKEVGMNILEHWLNDNTPITGGLKTRIIALRNKEDTVKTYGSRKEMIEIVSDSIIVRSTGIAWCTNDSFGCSGGQCEDCNHSIIDDSRQYHWEAIYAQQLELRAISDQVGPGGSATIERTIIRCEKVLSELGADINEIKKRITEHAKKN